MQNPSTLKLFAPVHPRRHGRVSGAIPLLFLCVVALSFCLPAAWAQDNAQPDSERDGESTTVEDLNIEAPGGWESENLGKLQVAPVVVNGEVLFHIVGVASFPAERRAEEIVKKIEALAEDVSFNPKTLHITEEDGRHVIYRDKLSGSSSVMTIHDEDAALEGLDRDVIAATFREKITVTVEAYRRDSRPEAMMATALQALLRTMVLIAVLYGVVWSFRRLDAVLERRFKRKIKKLEARSMHIIQAEQVWNVLRGVLKTLHAIIILALIYLFLNFVLSLFPSTRYIAKTLLYHVLEPLSDMGAAVINYIPSLIYLVLLFFVTRYVLKLTRTFFDAIARGSVQFASFDADWAIPTYRLVRVVIVVIAVVLAYPYIPGSDSDAFKGISILLGVLFSLGSSSMISNVIAGYTMTYRRAFRIGDRVKIGETLGDVTEMRLLVTHVCTLKNEEVVIPNSAILNNEITNFSTMAKDQGLILHTTVGIGYEVPWRQVEAMLLMAADRTGGILKEPKPFVLQNALADYAVNYELNAYCDDEKQAMELYSALHRNIQDVFNEYGIQIMTPSYRSDTPEPKTVPKDQWYAAPAVAPATEQS